MKRILPLVCLLTCYAVFAQTDFQHGDIIDQNGKKFTGNIQWSIKYGTDFYFKSDQSKKGIIQRMEVTDIARVNFDNGSAYCIVPWKDSCHILERDLSGPYIELWHDVTQLDYVLYLSKPKQMPFLQLRTVAVPSMGHTIFSIAEMRGPDGNEVFWYKLKSSIQFDLQRCHISSPIIGKLLDSAIRDVYYLGLLCDSLNASKVFNQTDGGALLSHITIEMGVGKIFPHFYMKGSDPDFGTLHFSPSTSNYYALNLLFKKPHEDRQWTGGASFYFFQGQLLASSIAPGGGSSGSRSLHTDYTQMGFGPTISFLPFPVRKFSPHFSLSAFMDILGYANEKILSGNTNTAVKLSRDFGMTSQSFSFRFTYGLRWNLPHTGALELNAFATYMTNLTYTENYLISQYGYGTSIFYSFNR